MVTHSNVVGVDVVGAWNGRVSIFEYDSGVVDWRRRGWMSVQGVTVRGEGGGDSETHPHHTHPTPTHLTAVLHHFHHSTGDPLPFAQSQRLTRQNVLVSVLLLVLQLGPLLATVQVLVLLLLQLLKLLPESCLAKVLCCNLHQVCDPSMDV